MSHAPQHCPASTHCAYTHALRCGLVRLGKQMTAPSFCFVFAVARCSYCVPEYATMHSLSVHYLLNMHWLRVYNRSCSTGLAPLPLLSHWRCCMSSVVCCMASVICRSTYLTPCITAASKAKQACAACQPLPCSCVRAHACMHLPMPLKHKQQPGSSKPRRPHPGHRHRGRGASVSGAEGRHAAVDRGDGKDDSQVHPASE